MKDKLKIKYPENILSLISDYSRQTRQSFKRHIFLPCLLVLFFVGTPFSAFSQNTAPTNTIIIKGQVRLPSGVNMPADALDVVLLKFVLSTEGQVTPAGPQGRVKTNPEGKYEFVGVSPDLRAGFQLGTRVETKLYSSKIFFMRDGETLIETDIIIPGISTAVENLETNQISMVVETGLAQITVTEVLLINNSSPDRIDSRSKPLQQKLPIGLKNFRMLETNSGTKIQHTLVDNFLKIENIFQPGNTQIIFQYNLPVWFGSLEINRKFNHSLDKVRVLTPEGVLQIESNQLISSAKQNLHETVFVTWNGKASDSTQLNFKISNVTASSLQYSGVAAVLLILLFSAVALFYRQRLLQQKQIEDPAS